MYRSLLGLVTHLSTFLIFLTCLELEKIGRLSDLAFGLAFATEGLKLTSALLAFSNQLEDDDKPLLLQEIDKMVPAYQQLQVTAKTPAQGKTATFTKVDTSIHKAKYILDILAQVLPLSCKLLRKHKAGNGYLRAHRPWRENGLHAIAKEGSGLAGRNDSFGIKSLEQHVASLTFLENKQF